jgi:hypothetical protein
MRTVQNLGSHIQFNISVTKVADLVAQQPLSDRTLEALSNNTTINIREVTDRDLQETTPPSP